ncbi:ABC transporter ATP-binding protein [Nocardiopsis kunsanensis]|uniref:ABC transporter ATP-binding protein n=1 Tax=Nocardiopsis kunsanensis TaxID=141693 RepID=A0A918X997_9ACTN|nr:ABC transporter ATP-binding protein [Nocardiopsis kunsanensis]GHD19530.1 ABC transporter ATP-binding protein [Nocardiopsis kunsanensis]
MSMERAAWSSLYHATHAEQDHRPFSAATLRRIGAFARPRARALAWFLVLSVFTAALAVASPLLAGQVVDLIVAGGPLRTVVALAALIAGVAVAEAGLGLLVRLLSARVGEGLIVDLRTSVYDHVQRMPVAFFTRARTGALVSRLNNDVIGAQRAFSDVLSGIVSNVVTLLLALGAMLVLSWQITLAALALLPLFVLPARRMGVRLARMERERAAHNAAMGTRMTERFSASGATLIKLSGRPGAESAEFARRADRVGRIGVRTAMVQEVFFTALTLVSALALALVYGLGGFYALSGGVQAGTVVSMGMLLTRLYAPLTELAGARVEVMSALVSFSRVFEVLDLRPLVAEGERARALLNCSPEVGLPNPVPSTGEQFMPEGPLSLELEGVDFTYPGAWQVSLASLEEGADPEAGASSPVLEQVSFTVEPGQMVALVGSSGAGKSTVAALVPRLYDPDAGSVRLGGQDVRELTFATLRSKVAMVTQDGHLLHESIRANLALAAPGASDDQLWRALEQARLGELVAALPQGLETVVGERGHRFSGGERQRLAIARLLLAEPEVVVLDEATSALDSTSEAAVQQALQGALSGRTSLVIAHRLSTIRAADAICVVEQGRIVERGTHAELLARQGRYAQLYRTQFSEGEQVGAGL